MSEEGGKTRRGNADRRKFLETSSELTKNINDQFTCKKGKGKVKSRTNTKTKTTTRTRSHKLITRSEGNKTTGLKVGADEPENIENEMEDEERFNESSEPVIELHCKAKYIKLKPISKSDLEGKDLYIEVEIDKDLRVSPIEKYESPSGKKSKYTFKVSLAYEIKSGKKFNNETNGKNNSRRKRENENIMTVEETADSEEAHIPERKKTKRTQSTSVQLKGSASKAYEPPRDCSQNDCSEPKLDEDKTLITHKMNVDESLECNDSDSGGETNCKIDNVENIREEDKIKSDTIETKTEPQIRKKKNVAPKQKKTASKKKQTKSIEYSTRITEDGEKLFGCPLCNYESKYSQNIRSHYLIHMNVKPWICEKCGSAFVSKCNLRHHMISHSNNRPFKCPTCGMGFKQKVVLQQHVARHNEDRQYVCEQCGKGFCISGDLKKHIRTHTGEKPYTCEVCFKQFSDNSSFARHRYLHNEVKNFACPKCDKKFSRRDMCNSHMKIHNNDSAAGPKTKKGNEKRTKKSVVNTNVIEEQVEMEVENRDTAPREHLYHIENYAKEIQERTYTDMDVNRTFSVAASYPPHQQQQQPMQGYPQRVDPGVQQESYSRDNIAMWANLHFY